MMEEGVPDSTDWIGTTLPGIGSVESALRCQLCKDFYQTPMLTDCSHTFCSVCIRRALSNDGKCPVCRSSQQETKLRKCWALEEVVTAFAAARPSVIKLARLSPAAILPLAETTWPSSSKRGLNTTEEPNKRIRTSERLSRRRGAQTAASMTKETIDVIIDGNESDEQDEFISPDDGLVACPICNRKMREQDVNHHLDTTCLGAQQTDPPEPKSSISTFRSPRKKPINSVPIERLPALNYSMYKDGALRKKLQELGISHSGTRAIIEKRHREWVTLWNANCDAAKPKTKFELRRDLDLWEKTQGTRAPASSKAATVGSMIKDKEFDGHAWARMHNGSFQDLVAQARRSMQQSKEKLIGGTNDDTASSETKQKGPVTKHLPAIESPNAEKKNKISLYPGSSPNFAALPSQDLPGVLTKPPIVVPSTNASGQPSYANINEIGSPQTQSTSRASLGPS